MSTTAPTKPIESFDDLVAATEATEYTYTDPEQRTLTEKLVYVFFWLPVYLVAFLVVALTCTGVFLSLYGVDMGRAAFYGLAWWTSTF